MGNEGVKRTLFKGKVFFFYWFHITNCPLAFWPGRNKWKRPLAFVHKSAFGGRKSLGKSSSRHPTCQLSNHAEQKERKKGQNNTQVKWAPPTKFLLNRFPEPLAPFVIAQKKTLPRWSSSGASYQKESIHLEKHLWAVGSFLDFDTKLNYIQLHLPSFWIWYRNF